MPRILRRQRLAGKKLGAIYRARGLIFHAFSQKKKKIRRLPFSLKKIPSRCAKDTPRKKSHGAMPRIAATTTRREKARGYISRPWSDFPCFFPKKKDSPIAIFSISVSPKFYRIQLLCLKNSPSFIETIQNP
jgi:hypothetical protein